MFSFIIEKIFPTLTDTLFSMLINPIPVKNAINNLLVLSSSILPDSHMIVTCLPHAGVIVKCVQRLDELCRDISKACKLVGDMQLAGLMQEVSTLITRDIIFAASLYTI